MSEARLPAHIEAGSMIRAVNAAGGFASVIHKGDPDAGALLVVIVENGKNSKLYERMPDLSGTRKWHCSRTEDTDNKQDFAEYLSRRAAQDRDSWIIELDIVNGERFIPGC